MMLMQSNKIFGVNRNKPDLIKYRQAQRKSLNGAFQRLDP